MKYLFAVLAILAVIGIWVIAGPVASHNYQQWRINRRNAAEKILDQRLMDKYYPKKYSRYYDPEKWTPDSELPERPASEFCADPDARQLGELDLSRLAEYEHELKLNCP